MEKISLSFYGGAREVSGACHFLEFGGHKILVDCGFFQGSRIAGEKNRAPFPFDVKTVEALVITHAHVDHIGRVPKLYKEGFRGKIYATPATADLLEVVLMDSLMLMEKECRFHREEIIYGREDVEGVLKFVEPLEYYQKINLGDNVSLELLNAGHILGSSFARFNINGRIIVFTGDVGSDTSVLLPMMDGVRDAEIMVIESAYGNRRHEHAVDKELLLERAIEDTVRQKGVLMIPVFATERTQDILFEINRMLALRRIPDIQAFLDSPMAIKTTEVFKRHPYLYKGEIKELIKEHQHLFDFRHLKFTETKEESKMINDVASPKLILAGSGMMEGGRILHHAIRYLPDPNSTLLIVGWQAGGSLGRRLLDGAKEVKIRGEMINVRAQIRVIDGYSAHADEPELCDFISQNRDTLKHLFVVQGDEDAALNLVQFAKDHFGITATAPAFGESFDL